ncbi:MAG TPA: hypothetical protein VFV85_04730 [Conexibacter sp.]|nr:hypothetical protein [Conexibacter sp.]
MRPRIALLIAFVAALALALPAAASARPHRPFHHHHHPQRVAATVTLDQPSGALTTATPISFSGVVSPANAGHRILLQRQVGADGDRWIAVDRGFVHADGGYAIVHRFRVPGDRTLRTVLLPNRRTLRSFSTPVSITVQQLQVAGFTIASSAQPIDFGQSATISGTLAGGASTSVTLFAREEFRGRLRPIANTTTDANGSYSFTQSPPHNTVYQVRVTSNPRQRSARLFQGVRDVVSIAPSATSANVGSVVTFTGTVQPSKAGHVIALQRLNGNNVWQTVAVSRVGAGSAYSIPYALAAAGSAQYRTLVPGGPVNQRGVSSAVSVTAIPSS